MDENLNYQEVINNRLKILDKVLEEDKTEIAKLITKPLSELKENELILEIVKLAEEMRVIMYTQFILKNKILGANNGEK